MRPTLPPTLLFLGAAVSALVAHAAQPRKQPTGVRTDPALSPPATEPSAITTVPGFKVELLYSVPRTDQGSWVALTVDPKGRILASDQYGGIFRLTPPPVGTSTGLKVEKLAIDLNKVVVAPPPGEPEVKKARKAPDGQVEHLETGAHGILCAFDSLYVMVNENRERAGLWRLRDTDGDDQYDDFKFLRFMRGGGEHGPHAVVLGSRRQVASTLANGNHTDLPTRPGKVAAPPPGARIICSRACGTPAATPAAASRPAATSSAPTPKGRPIELFTLGFRNQYDIAFDQNGELFTYDSDMEWDHRLPLVHAHAHQPRRRAPATSAGAPARGAGPNITPTAFGTTRRPRPRLHPPALTFGTGAKFPAQYQRALYACRLDLRHDVRRPPHARPAPPSAANAPKNSSPANRCRSPTPSSIPRDGAMYFTVGGRRTQAALYRVTYTGGESTAPARPALPPTAEAKTAPRCLKRISRRRCPRLRSPRSSPGRTSPARTASCVSPRASCMEKQPPAPTGPERALAETQPQAAIEALIALARVGPTSRYQPRHDRRPRAASTSPRQPAGLQPAAAARLAARVHPDGQTASARHRPPPSRSSL
jgi:hypothetical protein